jgi:hypothetical protein
MDIVKQLAECSTSSVPYRYDLGAGRDSSISYFVDNGFTQGFLCTQDSGPAHHESLGSRSV